MKMEESPLEVLSRAVSIVQNENKAKKRHSAPPMASSDSGIEEDLSTEYTTTSTEHCPRRATSMTLKPSPRRRDYDSDDSASRKSPRLFSTVKCFRNSPPLDSPHSKRPLSPENMSPQRMSPSPRESPHRRLSPDGYEGYPHYTRRERGSPESMDSDVYRYTMEECRRRSPKRTSMYEEGQRLKKIKIEEHQEDYESNGLPVLNHCSEGKRLSPKHASEPRHLAKGPPPPPPKESPSHHHPLGTPRYMHTYPPYPPLFVLADKPTQYSKLMETYDSIFAPKPPVHPPPLPAYTKCNCGDKNCVIITPPVSSPPPPYREKSEPHYREKSEPHYREKSEPHYREKSEPHYREKSEPHYREKSEVIYREKPEIHYDEKRETTEYGLPNVDEHFRKSLGEKYDVIKCEQANERPSSVDDHFAKALGQKWFKMEYGSKKCTSTKT